MPKAMSMLTVGNKIEVPVNSAYQSRFGSKIVFKVADKNHTGYPANSVTLIADQIIQVQSVDGKEASNSDTNRRNYGNNRFIHANLRQWMNSNAAAGQWYSAQHVADAPPNTANTNYNPYDSWAGFLAIFPEEFRNALMNTTLTVVRNTVTDGGSYETFTDKMFLASTTEVGLANENNIAEGSRLALFTADNTSRLAYPTTQAVSNSNYTNNGFNTSAAWHWWLRTPLVSNSYSVRYVNSSGALLNNYAFNGNIGLRPLCNLASDILVSDTVNSSGNYEIIWNRPPTTPNGISVPATCISQQSLSISWGASTDPDGDAITYVLERSANNGSFTEATRTGATSFSEVISTAWNTLVYRVKAVDTFNNQSAYMTSNQIAVIHNQPPVISGANGNLGVKGADFSYEYSVTDPDGDVVTVVEAINGATIKTHNVTLGQTYAMQIAGNTFVTLPAGQHTLTVTARDTSNNSAVRTMTFTKQVDGFTVTLSEPLEAVTQPRRANVKVSRVIPAGGTFKVEVTNNPYDPSPAWEDCTNAVLQGTAHVFENTVNAAIQHGMNIRVTVGRGSAISTCWVSGIGGNFE